MLENCNVIATFPICDQFEAIQNPVTFYFTKAGHRTKKIFNTTL